MEQLANLANIDAVQAMLPGAHLLRNAAFANYQGNTDEDAFEDEFMYDEYPPDGAQVICKEEFDITFIEFGTSKMAAQPFLRPAIDDNLDAIDSVVRDAVQKQLQDLVRSA